MESLTFGVPLVIVPQMIEQEMTGRRVQELGLGLTLDMDTLTLDCLRAAVEQVTHDAAIRTKLQEMQREIRKSGGYRRAVDAIIAYMQSGK
jgi:NDP-glycosyltransferase